MEQELVYFTDEDREFLRQVRDFVQENREVLPDGEGVHSIEFILGRLTGMAGRVAAVDADELQIRSMLN